MHRNNNMLASLLIFIGTVYCIVAAPTTDNQFEIVSGTVTYSSARSTSSSDYANKVISFWTDDKLKAAKPVMPSNKIGAKSNTQKTVKSTDPPVFADGTFGSLQKTAEIGSNRPTSKQVFGNTGRQTYTIGKIFWNNTGNSYGMCSAAIVAASNKDTIVTAGHCCYDYDAKKWRINQNFIFIPAYQNGAQPYGKWAARIMTAYTAWTVNQNYNYDVCFVNLYTNSKNQHIQDLLGAEGIGANYPRNALTYSFGYPYNLAKGEVMQYCSGYAALSKYGNGYVGQTIPCDMTGGCSGGPWLQNFTVSTGIGYVTSINSFMINNIPNYLNGPYFDSSIWSLYQLCAN